MNYLANAFSLSMLSFETLGLIRIKHVDASDIPADVISCIGHADTADILSGILSFSVLPNRMSLALNGADVLYVAQYQGTRLPEGTKILPQGTKFKFLKVETRSDYCCNCSGGNCESCTETMWAHGYDI